MIGMPDNLRVHWVWPSKYKGKWCFSPKCSFSETDHHTALKFAPLWLACMKMSGCTEFGPLNTKEGNVLAQNVFLWNRSSYSFEICTIVIDMLHNLGMHCLWPPYYKGKWCFSLKCFFLRNRPSYSFEICTIVIDMLHNLRMHCLWPPYYKGKWCFSLKCFFSQKQAIIQLWNLYHCDWHTWKLQGALSLAL